MSRRTGAALVPFVALCAVLLAQPRPSAATYATARAVGHSCATCHASKHPGSGNLNETGRYFLVERRLPESKLPGLQSAPPAGAAGGPPLAAASTSGDRAMVTDSAAELYARTCAMCHGPAGEGTPAGKALIGPLVHGERAADVVAVVSKGITGTAMFAFEELLSKAEIQAVSDYVVTMRGRRPSK